MSRGRREGELVWDIECKSVKYKTARAPAGGVDECPRGRGACGYFHSLMAGVGGRLEFRKTSSRPTAAVQRRERVMRVVAWGCWTWPRRGWKRSLQVVPKGWGWVAREGKN